MNDQAQAPEHPPEDWRTGAGRDRRARTRAKIVAAAFELLGSEHGLYTRIEDFAQAAGVSRPTFYNHFAGMEELREALSYEVTHDFLTAVTETISANPDPCWRAATAIRFYLHRARTDQRWAWSMVNLSANGLIFGAETYRQAERTVEEGMAAGVLAIPSSALGRDLILGSTLAAIGAMLRQDLPEDYPEQVAEHILLGLGVEPGVARDVSRAGLPAQA
ncbi:MAG: TetR/AcrR family transcriptional regulator [Sphingomonadaceae bacterium]|nr:TetR/AcrR family transcriptional regulator [Sphingomonadaceae bacterium]